MLDRLVIQGLSFKKGDIVVKGSQIDYSYGKLNQLFNPEKLESKNSLDQIPLEETFTKGPQESHSVKAEINKEPGVISGLAENMLFSVGGNSSEDDDLYKRKRRMRR